MEFAALTERLGLSEEDLEILQCALCFAEKEDIMALTTEGDVDGFCNHSFCLGCIMGHIETKQAHGLSAECPLCRRKILGVEKNATASKLFQLIKKIDKQIEEAQPMNANAVAPPPPPEQDNSALEAVREENAKVKRQLEEKNNLLEEKLNELKEFERKIKLEKEQREKATSILEFQLTEQQRQNQIEKRKATELEARLKVLEKGSQEAVALRAELIQGREKVAEGEKILALVEHKKSEAQAMIERANFEAQRLEKEAKDRQIETEELKQKLQEKEVEKRIQEESIQNLYDAYNKLKHQHEQMVSNQQESSIKKQPTPAQEKPVSPQYTLMSTIGYVSPIMSRIGNYIYGATPITGKLLVPDTFETLERRGSSLNCPVWKARDKTGVQVLKRFELAPYHPVEAEADSDLLLEFDDDGNLEELSKDAAVAKQEVALKKLHNNFEFYSRFREALYLSQIQHVNIIELKGILRKQTDSFYCVMPFIGCDAEFLSHGTRNSLMTLDQVQFIAYRILGALRYLHSADVVHRDIQAASVVVRTTEEAEIAKRKILSVKLVSFGSARSLRPPYCKIREVHNHTPSWRYAKSLGLFQQPELTKLRSPAYNMWQWAPELAVLEETGYAVDNFDWKKCDVWALGCMLATLLRGGDPIFVARKASSHMAEILRINECRSKDFRVTVEKEEFPLKSRWPEGSTSLGSLITYMPKSGKSLEKKEPILNTTNPQLTKNCVDLIAKMLAFDPLQRPSCDQLLLHPFFGNVARQPSVESVCLKGEAFSDLNLVAFAEDCGGP